MDNYLEFNQCYKIDLSQSDIHYTADGAVYKGIDSVSGKNIACKLINVTGDYKYALNQVRQEMSVLQRLEKEFINIPRIYGIREDRSNGKIWLLMEWIEGQTLEEKMKKRVQSIRFLEYMKQLSEILMVLEKNRITHKDIKPSNIIINQNPITMCEKVFLIDFDISLNLSMRGEGTDGYRAPEMWTTSSSVQRDKADLFSIGVIMYEYYTGTVPKRGIEYSTSMSRRKEWKTFISPREKNENIAEELNELIVKLMQYNPEERVKNASDLKKGIESIIKDTRKVNRNGNNRA